MPRPRKATSTELGQAVVKKRDGQPLSDLGKALGVSHATLSSVETGAHRPSLDTALALARWLGWSVEDVVAAAKRPVDVSTT